MNSIRHCGIYVNDLKRMQDFYINIFNMHIICKEQEDVGFFVDALVGAKDSKILITKLITDQGKVTGTGDMIELIKVVGKEEVISDREFTKVGTVHIALECKKLEHVYEQILFLGGKGLVAPFVRENGNKLCFCKDIEGNCLELIERRE